MFTGLVCGLGIVRTVAAFGNGKRFHIDLGDSGVLAGGIAIGQSIAVNGACLTVASRSGTEAIFEAVSETVSRTNLGRLHTGDRVNLEPALKAGGALDGHIMLGHVDAVAAILAVEAGAADSRSIRVALPAELRHLVAEKGSVALDGVSLTVSGTGDGWFSAAVIPLTWKSTTLSLRSPGDGVNIEVDVLARYAARILQCAPDAPGGLTEDVLRRNGFA